MDGYNYDALASTVKIEDIPYISEVNKGILRRLKDNDPDFEKLRICEDDYGRDDYYCPGDNVEELGWLGYYLGRNTTLQELLFFSRTIYDANFYLGLARNKSIRKIEFSHNIDLTDGQIFQMVAPFLKKNHNLTEFEVDECELGAEGIRQMSMALGGCNNKLKQIRLANNQIEDGQLLEIIDALNMHQQLEVLI